MLNVITIIEQIYLLFILGGIGFLVGKTRYLPAESGKILSMVVVRLTAPLLIATKMFKVDFSKAEFYDGIKLYFFALFMLGIAYAVAFASTKAMKLSGATANIYKMQSMFGNVIYFAYPLLQALAGDKGIVYATFFNLGNDTLLWTLGIYLVSKHDTDKGKTNLKHLINANTIAFAIGIIFLIFKAGSKLDAMASSTLKEILTKTMDTLASIGGTTTLFSMIFIGIMLSQIKFGSVKEFLKRYAVFILSIQKLVFIPIVAIFVLWLLRDFIPSFPSTIAALQIAMPCATITPALAVQYDSDYRFATEAVFVTTIFSMLSLPIILILFKAVI